MNYQSAKDEVGSLCLLGSGQLTLMSGVRPAFWRSSQVEMTVLITNVSSSWEDLLRSIHKVLMSQILKSITCPFNVQ